MAVSSVAGIESGSWMMQRNGRKVEKKGRKRGNVSCAFSSSPPASLSYVADPYKTLRVRPGASESEVKKAFRQLALQYHPDVCRGSNCGVQFHQINEAYDIVMSNLRGEPMARELYEYEYEERGGEVTGGMDDPDWELWEEWMGWEGAGTRDYTSHINPYT